LERTVSSVAGRKNRHPPATPDPDAVRALVSAFQSLRSLFPANYLCLFDSLALLYFLAMDGIYPTWVFAVRFDPWKAHCWLQTDTVLLNEEVDETSEYTPIMAI
jgi:hypothetical protein